MNHTKPVKIFFKKKFFQWKNVFSNFFYSLSSVLCTPVYEKVQKNSWKMFSTELLFLISNVFFSTFLCNPIKNFYRTLQKSFFVKLFFHDEKNIFWRMFFFQITLLLCAPADNNVNQNIFLKNTSLKNNKFWIYFLFPSSFVCTPLIVHTRPTKKVYLKGFSEKKFSKKQLFSSSIDSPYPPFITKSFKIVFAETPYPKKTVFRNFYFVYNINSVYPIDGS